MRFTDVLDKPYREPDAVPVDYHSVTLYVRPWGNRAFVRKLAEIDLALRSEKPLDQIDAQYELLASTILVDWSGFEDGTPYSVDNARTLLQHRDDAMELVQRTAHRLSREHLAAQEAEEGNSAASSDALFDESPTTTQSLTPTE